MCENKKLSIMAESLQSGQMQLKRFEKHTILKGIHYNAGSISKKDLNFRRRIGSMALDLVVMLAIMGVLTLIFR